jgi:phage portal protein BeeE
MDSIDENKNENVNSAQVAKLTGYRPITVRKYALMLNIPSITVGKVKVYSWSQEDIKRFKEAVISPSGRRDRRGEKNKK